MASSSAYIIVGHGVEDVMAERQIVPKGVTLVTMTECGMVISDYQIMEIIHTVPDYYHPEKLPYPKYRVYTEGEEMPTLFAGLFSKHYNSTTHTYDIQKSGVYSLPLNPDISPSSFIDAYRDGNIYTVKHGGQPLEILDNKDNLIDSIYEYSMFPPKSKLETFNDVFGNTVPLPVVERAYPLSEIFKTVGDGIYYFPLCRAIHGINISKYQENIPTTNTLNAARYLISLPNTPRANIKRLTNLIDNTKMRRVKSARRQEKRLIARGVGGSRMSRKRRFAFRKEKQSQFLHREPF